MAFTNLRTTPNMITEMSGEKVVDLLNKQEELTHDNSKPSVYYTGVKRDDTNSSSNNSTDTKEEEVKVIDNIVSGNQELIDRYGYRQEIVIKNSKEDPYIKAKRILSENQKPNEELIVKCIGDLNYRVGFGVHVNLPFLPKYYDCLMYVKEVEHEWLKDGFFTSELTLTPSRVMDEQEWSDLEDIDENESVSGSELWEKIYSVLKQQIGKPYIYGASDPDIGFDCSGLVQYCYNQFESELGMHIERTTYAIVKQGKFVDSGNMEEWQPGDLVFPHEGHIVVYTGNGKCIEAWKTGTNVMEHDYTRTKTFAVRRVLPEVVNRLGSGEIESGGYSSQLVEFTKSWEGFSSTWYTGDGTYTIGYGISTAGSLGKKLRSEGITSCTETEATQWLKEELNVWAKEVKKYEDKYGIELNQQAFDVCVDLSFQWGYTYLQKSEFMKALGNGNFDKACSMISGYPRRDNARKDILWKGKYTLND